MEQWDLLCKIVDASNEGNQSLVSKLILENDFEGKPQAQDAAVSAFTITKENIAEHMPAAEKLASFDPPDGVGFSFPFRINLIHGIIKEINEDHSSE